MSRWIGVSQCRRSIPSVNTLYHARALGKGRAYLYKDTDVATFQKEIEEDFNRQLPYLDHDKFYELILIFLIADGYGERDTSNMIKATEDAIAKVLRVDDKRNLVVISAKCPSIDEHEHVVVIVKETPPLSISALMERFL